MFRRSPFLARGLTPLLVRCLLALSLVARCFSLPARAQDEERLIERCRQATLACQMQDGAIVAVAYREAGRPALVDPYFSSLACAGILAAEQRRPDEANRRFADRWLHWYARREKADGKILLLDGRRGPQGLDSVQTSPPDALDSAAAGYLYVAGRYSRLTNTKLDPEIAAACLRMLDTLERCHNSHDLFWNYPEDRTPRGDPHTEYLLDNIEVYQGLREVAEPLEAAGYCAEAKKARNWADRLATRLADFWSPQDQYFVCQYGDRRANVPFGKQPLHAEGLATVSALALLDHVSDACRTALWNKLQKIHGDALQAQYQAGDYKNEDPTIERVFQAALRAAPAADVVRHRELLRARTTALLQRNDRLGDPVALQDGQPFPWVHRFALMLVALASPARTATPYLPTVPLPIAVTLPDETRR